MTGQVNYLVEAPKLGQEYYCLFVMKGPYYALFKWRGTDSEKKWLVIHRVYPTEPDIQRAAEFLNNFLISHKEQLNYLTSEPEPGTEVWYDMNMGGKQFDTESINFDPKDDSHQKLFKNVYFFRTREDLKKAINLITEALEEEYKKAH
ncbi:hypothetical protein GY065_10430 [Snodgrassella sp. ESL0323]|uniref:hypothetical protein n=1 Tax=Snodgrassella sp. ESL0323 TaxID=2705034 RepID=UPI0015839694|nr:hypothetical protein [Snodgrassella sp. ESL0323]NUF79317.1 hypothetical protein [Snodgrassella sp. ESL0323]